MQRQDWDYSNGIDDRVHSKNERVNRLAYVVDDSPLASLSSEAMPPGRMTGSSETYPFRLGASGSQSYGM